MIDGILSASPRPPVIILLGDHGFRNKDPEIARSYDFINLNAVYFPDKNYETLNDTIGNVNELRIVFNKYFNQHLPLLADSTIRLWGVGATSDN